MTSLVWLLPALAVAMVVHEGGHLLCGVIGSIPIRLVSIGLGPLLLRARVGETRLELRLLPVAGFVAAYPVVVIRKHWQLLFLLGGVLGNMALIGLVAWLDSVGAVPKRSDDVLGPIVFTQLIAIVVNLIPFRARMNGTRQPTDGLQMLQLLFRRRDIAADASRAYALLIGPYAGGASPQPSDASLRIVHHVSRPERWTSPEVRHDVQDALQRELARGDLAREDEMLVLDCLVTDGLIYGDPAMRSRIDGWSRRARELGPEIATLAGSRGAVLVELGRTKAGKALLETVEGWDQPNPFDSLMTHIYLAKAEYALGNGAAARRLAAIARAAVAGATAASGVAGLIERTEAEIGLADG
jgi:peptidase M50-like protein